MLNKLLKNQTIKDASGFLFSTATSKLFALLSSIFVIRELGPELRGYYVFLSLIGFFLVPLFSLGINQGANYFVASKHYQVKDVTGSLILVATLLGIISFFFAFLLKSFDLLGVTGKEISFAVLLPVIITYPFSMVRSMLYTLLLADSKYWVGNKLVVMNSIIPPAFIFTTVVVLHLELTGIVIALVSSNITLFIWTFFVFTRNYSLSKLSFSFNSPFIKKVLVYGTKAWIGTLAVQTNNRIDQLILSYFLKATDLGLYSICSHIGQIVWIIPSAFRQIIFNKNSELENEEEKKIYTAQFHNRLIFTGVIFGGILLVFSKPIISLLYGHEFISVNNAAKVYIIGATAYVGTMILTKYFAGSDQVIINSKIQLISAIASVLTAFILVPVMGLIGAALSSTLAYFTSYTLALAFFTNKFKEQAYLKKGGLF